MLNSVKLKQDFPLLRRAVHDQPLVYLDNAATSQKPQTVIKAIVNYYQNHNANVHRGVHRLSDESTEILEQSREQISRFFAAEPAELIFTRNATEAINGVAYGWADHHLNEDDVILTSQMEHHSNLVVWQQAAARTGASLEFVRVTDEDKLDLDHFKEQLDRFGERLKLISLVYVSNTLGTVNPLDELVSLVKAKFSQQTRPRILLDGAQAVPHMPINFTELEVDFLAFSGHKMLGPMGVGGLLVRQELLQTEELRPWLFGGGMIAQVHQRSTEFHPELTERFTAGTPDVASVTGLAAACQYLANLGMTQVLEHDLALVVYALEELAQVPAVTIIGPKAVGSSQDPQRLGSVAFLYDDVHAHDVSQVLDSQGIAVRSGHHCTMPLHQTKDWLATTRASFQLYTSKDDIDALVAGLDKVARVFA